VSGAFDQNHRRLLEDRADLKICSAPEGMDALLIADMARIRAAGEHGGDIVFVARDDAQASRIRAGLSFFAPDLEVLSFPAWDCLPYDRVSPRAEILAERMACLSVLAIGSEERQPAVILTTSNAMIQRVPPRESVASASFHASPGQVLDLEALTVFLARNGYSRSSTVREAGEFAIRGGIVDLFPPGQPQPVRLDMFGDTLESIRTFDAETQRTSGQVKTLSLVPVAETPLDEESIRQFRTSYVSRFGTVTGNDPLYEAVSEGRRHQSMEHWLPLFYDTLESLFDYLADESIVLADHLADEARKTRWSQIEDYYQARSEHEFGTGKSDSYESVAYNALPPDCLYLDQEEWRSLLSKSLTRTVSPFDEPDAADVYSLGARQGRNFSPERQTEGANVFDALIRHLAALQSDGKKTFVACWSEGSADRMLGVLSDHGLQDLIICPTWQDASALPPQSTGLLVLGLEAGIETPAFAIIAEQDILGDRLVRSARSSRRAANFIAEATSLSQGDIVVHVDHGIGRYDGLETVDVSGAPHDCLLILYQGGDKLYLPVENIELLSRYGSDDLNVQLDRLGGSGWQARKAKLKERIREMADQLIKVAAARALRKGQVLNPAQGLYDEFCARFPYEETEDQIHAIEDVLEDLSSGRPMDRLVCGDVGFGKTEVALRTAFVAAMSGLQVAVVTPTTLLCRQHTKTFADRFAGWPIKVRQLSRMVSAADAKETREGMARGDVDIVVGTHALLGNSVEFKNLGLLIIDEEQHFGVAHKERLKQMRTDVHVLTLTATPIPRTLQLAMSGVRELSLIASPPVDRLAIRTFVAPFDEMIVREALLREHYRGGQSFYVCPRISDLGEAAEFLSANIPEVKFVIAHGQMPPGQLDDIMNAFYDGQYDVLLSTTIVESGLDIPRANTMVIHRADMFGLAQLYQLRGRIGRSKVRAYAYLTVRPNRTLTANAEKRLKVLQSLDSLGAGFSLASHDLDIRGAGNLLGDEQSGQIREVGIELYQSMLEEAVAALQDSDDLSAQDERWSPQINIGTSVLIPDSYVQDLDVRLGLYRRLSELESRQDIDAFAAELIDRFGALPEEVDHLLEIVTIKQLCFSAGVEKVDAGPKGATVSFRKNEFANPAGLVAYIAQSEQDVKLRPDQKLVFRRSWPAAAQRLKGVKLVLGVLSEIADEAEAVA